MKESEKLIAEFASKWCDEDGSDLFVRIIKAELAAIRSAVLEEAAQACDDLFHETDDDWPGAFACAEALRALRPPGEKV